MIFAALRGVSTMILDRSAMMASATAIPASDEAVGVWRLRDVLPDSALQLTSSSLTLAPRSWTRGTVDAARATPSQLESIMTLALVRVHGSPAPSLAAILRESRDEGFRFVERLVHEWESGANRFSQPGELLLTLRRGPSSLAVCGLNVDPFARSESVGRLRHLYVAKAWRRQRWGSRMVRVIASQASPRFRLLRLRTHSKAAAAFYVRLGFCEVVEPDATHLLWLGASDASRSAAV